MATSKQEAVAARKSNNSNNFSWLQSRNALAKSASLLKGKTEEHFFLGILACSHRRVRSLVSDTILTVRKQLPPFNSFRTSESEGAFPLNFNKAHQLADSALNLAPGMAD